MWYILGEQECVRLAIWAFFCRLRHPISQFHCTVRVMMTGLFLFTVCFPLGHKVLMTERGEGNTLPVVSGD